MTISKRELMCDYGNCTNTMVAGRDRKVTVTIAPNGVGYHTRALFCCEEHAARWLARGRNWQHSPEAARDARLYGNNFWRALAQSIYGEAPTEAQIERVRAEYEKHKAGGVQA